MLGVWKMINPFLFTLKHCCLIEKLLFASFSKLACTQNLISSQKKNENFTNNSWTIKNLGHWTDNFVVQQRVAIGFSVLHHGYNFQCIVSGWFGQIDYRMHSMFLHHIGDDWNWNRLCQYRRTKATIVQIHLSGWRAHQSQWVYHNELDQICSNSNFYSTKICKMFQDCRVQHRMQSMTQPINGLNDFLNIWTFPWQLSRTA